MRSLLPGRVRRLQQRPAGEVADGWTQGITRFTGTCSESNGRCHCDVEGTADGTEEGTYVVEGSRLTVTGADGDVDELTFCQRGDQLFVEDSSSRTTYRRKQDAARSGCDVVPARRWPPSPEMTMDTSTARAYRG